MAFLFAAFVTGCDAFGQSESPLTPGNSHQNGLQLDRVLTSLSSDSPNNLAWQSNGGLLVREQAGRPRFVEPGGPSEENLVAEGMLDIRDKLIDRQGEEGVLGSALTPGGAGQVRVCDSVTNPRRSVISRFDCSIDNRVPGSENELFILVLEQPYPNHNGGQFGFDPNGYLYVGLGDGRSIGAPFRQRLGHNNTPGFNSPYRRVPIHPRAALLYPAQQPVSGGDILGYVGG